MMTRNFRNHWRLIQQQTTNEFIYLDTQLILEEHNLMSEISKDIKSQSLKVPVLS